MHLLVDVGNTRAKWALSDERALRESAVAAHAQLAIELRAYLATHGPNVTKAVIANVAGESITQILVRVLGEHAQIQPTFLHSTPELCGVRNAYPAPERLGIDRLVAMVGARAMQIGALCVVCVGTAMTVDVVDRSGQHQGGLIVPGPRLMVSSLIANTSEIGARAAQGKRDTGLLATDTRGAIEQGAEQTLAALVERVSAISGKQLGEPPSVLLTGGGADFIAPLLPDARVVPDLTLRGLARVAEDS